MGIQVDPAEGVRPFSNGSQYGDWRSRNCYRCVKSYENTKPEPKDGMGPCAIDNAVGLAYIGSGSVTPEIGKRMGWNHDKPFYGWDCPERELAAKEKLSIGDELSVKILNGDVKTRLECANEYATVIRTARIEGDCDVSSLNDAIILRWSRSGLDFIKKNAWRIVDPGSEAAS